MKLIVIVLAFLAAGCGGLGLNAEAIEETVEFADLLPSTMLRNAGGTQLSLKEAAKLGANLSASSNYVEDPSALSITDTPSIYYSWSSFECGLSGTLEERIANCAEASDESTWDGTKYGTGAESLWQRVYRRQVDDGMGNTVDYDIWYDSRTKLLWTSIFYKFYSADPIGPPVLPADGLYGRRMTWSEASSECAAGGADDVFGGINNVSWRLPSISDFQLANIDGLFWVYRVNYPDDIGSLWTASSEDNSNSYIVYGGTKLRSFYSYPNTTLTYAICVGRYSETGL